MPKLAAEHAAAARRPLFTITYAQSINGAIAARQGHPTVISGDETMTLTHKLRHAHDAILVGVGTVLSDDPQLTARVDGLETDNPRPLILDTSLRTPVDARVLRNPDAVIFTANAARMTRATCIQVATDDVGRLDLHQVANSTYELGIHSVMVEGGSRVISSFLKAGLGDWAVVTIAPVFLDGYSVLSASNGQMVKLKHVQYQQVGADMLVWGVL